MIRVFDKLKRQPLLLSVLFFAAFSVFIFGVSKANGENESENAGRNEYIRERQREMSRDEKPLDVEHNAISGSIVIVIIGAVSLVTITFTISRYVANAENATKNLAGQLKELKSDNERREKEQRESYDKRERDSQAFRHRVNGMLFHLALAMKVDVNELQELEDKLKSQG